MMYPFITLNKQTETANSSSEAVSDPDKDKLSRDEGRKAFYQLRDEARKNGIQGMTLEEINAEIAAARIEK